MWYEGFIRISGFIFLITAVCFILFQLAKAIYNEFKEANDKQRRQKIIEYSVIAVICLAVFIVARLTFADNLYDWFTRLENYTLFRDAPNLSPEELELLK